MPSSQFIDHVKIHFRSGNGGPGAVHFRRARFEPKGGPDGGDGGRGGSIVLLGNSQLSTLLHLKFRKHIHAKDGVRGGAKNCTGANAQDIYIEVPLGTVVKDEPTNQLLGEIIEERKPFILMKGGQGGKGNVFFKSSVQQVPRIAQEGKKGEEGWKVLELKLLADIGLVGLPNAGKSTLLSVLSAAKPKIAPYSFTTLHPQLGIVAHGEKSFVLADIPGLIQGAAKGKGLGVRFLRHIQRNKLLAFVIAADSLDVASIYRALYQELEAYDSNLLKKKKLLIISKADLLLTPKKKKQIQDSLPPNIESIFISSHQKKGLSLLKSKLLHLLESQYPS